uniref:Uncharacterized protein n=1 Tax=Dulem virus 208 TaxID=3145685 RepID=A0AAU8BCB8_9VIRU
MKIFWIKIVDLLVKNVLPIAVELLVELLEKKLNNEKKKVELA